MKNINSAIEGLSENDLKEIVKWEIEVLEKKHEDRFTKIESNAKKNKQQMTDSIESFKNDTTNEFENLKS